MDKAAAFSELRSKLTQKCAAYFSELNFIYQELTVVVPREQLLPFSTMLRDDPDFDFKCLVDISGVDYLTYGQGEWETDQATLTGFSRAVDDTIASASNAFPTRFAVAYHLLSLTHRMRLRLKVFLDAEKTQCPWTYSVVSLWPSANWFEREVFDLLGIEFKGHPDLRRILTDYGFTGHPLRKDFPLIGYGEVRYDEAQQKVIYEPVSIEPRVLVPRAIRKKSG